MSFHFGRKKKILVVASKMNMPTFFPVVSNEQYAMSKKSGRKKIVRIENICRID